MMPSERTGLRASCAYKIAEQAGRALRLELTCHPKPGLVTPYSNGSHDDMDMARMAAGIDAIAPFFASLAEAGAIGAPFRALQEIGIEAEAAMMRATQGVNTHRGAIFALGLLTAAAAYLRETEATTNAETVCLTVAQKWGAEIAENMDKAGMTHGAVAAFKYGAGGARAEAILGMPTARLIGVPTMRKALASGHTGQDASVQTLFAIMARLEDTNVLYRAGAPGLRRTQRLAEWFIRRGGVDAPDWKPVAERIGAKLQAKWISPGGAADVLSSTIFLMTMEGRDTAWD